VRHIRIDLFGEIAPTFLTAPVSYANDVVGPLARLMSIDALLVIVTPAPG
jgi:hypothetical protein